MQGQDRTQTIPLQCLLIDEATGRKSMRGSGIVGNVRGWTSEQSSQIATYCFKITRIDFVAASEGADVCDVGQIEGVLCLMSIDADAHPFG